MLDLETAPHRAGSGCRITVGESWEAVPWEAVPGNRSVDALEVTMFVGERRSLKARMETETKAVRDTRVRNSKEGSVPGERTMKEANAVASAWQVSHVGTPPVGFTMREDHPDAWARLHTLPLAKRIPSSESERDTVLDRWNKVAGLVFQAPGTVGVFVLDAGPTGTPGHSPTLIEQMGMSRVLRCPDEWLRRLDVYMDMSEAVIWAGTLSWAAGCLDELILAAATDDVGPVTVFSIERGDALCPYDGGVDSFLREPLRTSVATVFRDWVA